MFIAYPSHINPIQKTTSEDYGYSNNRDSNSKHRRKNRNEEEYDSFIKCLDMEMERLKKTSI